MYTNLSSLLLLSFLLAPLVTSTPLTFKPTSISPRQDAADGGVAAGAGTDTSNLGDSIDGTSDSGDTGIDAGVAAGVAAAAASAGANAADANNAAASLADAMNADNGHNAAPGSGAASGVNGATLSLIEQEEGFAADFYNDAEGQQTIGYGHDCVQIGCSSITPPLSQPQAESLLISDLSAYESCVCALPNSGALSDNQYGALVSFTYNSGCGAVASAFGAQMANSDFAGICGALPSTNLKGGIVTGRRAMEAGLCVVPSGALSGC